MQSGTLSAAGLNLGSSSDPRSLQTASELYWYRLGGSQKQELLYRLITTPVVIISSRHHFMFSSYTNALKELEVE